MATIVRDFIVGADPARAWAAVADVGAVNRLITFLGTVTVDGDRRSCSLGEQGALHELIVSVDHEHRRFAYTMQDSPFGFEHHHASMQVIPSDTGTRFVWTTDFKPDTLVDAVTPAIDAGVESIKASLAS